MLNADAFVALCRVYKCDNPMDIFDTPSINPNEINLIEKHRTLDPFGQDFIFDDIPTTLIEAPSADADFIIGVNGDSMEPDYHDGEILSFQEMRTYAW